MDRQKQLKDLMQLKHMDPAARESSFRKQQQESEDLRKMQGYVETYKSPISFQHRNPHNER